MEPQGSAVADQSTRGLPCQLSCLSHCVSRIVRKPTEECTVLRSPEVKVEKGPKHSKLKQSHTWG